MWHDLYWREVGWLSLLMLPIILLVVRRQQRLSALHQIADHHLWPWLNAQTQPRSQRWRSVTLVLAWVCFVVALAGPRTVLPLAAGGAPAQGELWLIMDLSDSMRAAEPVQDRRKQAAGLVAQWLEAAPPIKVAAVVFSGRAHLLLPLTADKRVAAQILADAGAITLPTTGNDLSGALNLMAKHSETPKHRVGVILTDGDLGQYAQAAALKSMLRLRSEQWQFRVVGVGSMQDLPIPNAQSGWLQHQGRPVLSRRQDAALQDLAVAGGSPPLGLDGETLGLASIWPFAPPRVSADQTQFTPWQEWFAWPLLLGLLLLLISLTDARKLLAIIAAVSMMNLAPDQAFASDAENNPMLSTSAYMLSMHEGVQCYRASDWGCAQRAFAAAAWQAASDQERGLAAFNLGNSYFRQGAFELSSSLYRDALANGVAAEYAQHNLHIAETVIAQIRRRQAQTRASNSRPAAGGGEQRDARPGESEALSLSKAAEILPPLPDGVSTLQLNRWVEQGMARASSRRDVSSNATSLHRAWLQDSERAQQRSTVSLWESLFALEEGFSGAQTERRARDGQQKW